MTCGRIISGSFFDADMVFDNNKNKYRAENVTGGVTTERPMGGGKENTYLPLCIRNLIVLMMALGLL